MKRLPFALVALSLSIPVVACLNNAGEEDVASGENDLSQAARDACNFGFTPVDNAVRNKAEDTAASKLTLSSSAALAITPGQKLLWGDFNGDGNQDFAVVRGREEVQVYRGDGKGAFLKSKTAKKLPKIAGRDRTAISIVSTGDFDGDGKSDLAAIATSVAAGADKEDEATRLGHLTILYGADVDASLEAPKEVLSLPDAIADYTYYHESGDLNDDGKDDLVITTLKGETVAFGTAERTLKPVPSGLTSDRVRSLAFITPKTADKPAALVIAMPKEIATITYDAAGTPTVAKLDYEFPANTSLWTSTDLDQNAVREISILGPDGLTVIPVSAHQAVGLTFEKVPGVLIGSADFDGNKSSEVLYKVGDEKLFAACGAGERAGQIVAAPLKVAYGKDLIVAGHLDLNKDGKADIVTLDISADTSATSPRGTVSVYLSSGKEDPAPALETFSTAGGGTTPTPEAGADVAPGTDSSTTTPEASTGMDASAPIKDAAPGTDATAPKPDAGAKDAAAPKPDGGKKDAGVKKDSGTSEPDNADDDDDTIGGDDDDDDDGNPPGDGEGTGTKNDPPTKRPTTRPSNGASTGGATVSAIPTPVATDDGCSAAPGSHGISSSAVGGLFAAMMLLVRRRRSKKA